MPLPAQGPLTDLEKRDRLRAAFDATRAFFQDGLGTLREERGFAVDLEVIDSRSFEARAERNGRVAAFCHVACSGRSGFGEGITYSESQRGGSINDSLTVENDGTFRAMAGSFMHPTGGLDPSALETADEVAQYLWERFIWRLQSQ